VWSPQLTSPPGEPKSKSSTGTIAYNENTILPDDLIQAFKDQRNGNYKAAANLFKNYLINAKGSSFRILATVQYLKTLELFMDAATASNDIQQAINQVRDQDILFELLLGQSSKLIKTKNSSVALNSLGQTSIFNLPQSKKNRVLFQKSFLYANLLNDLDKAKECLLEILANNDPGTDDYLLAEDELDLLSNNNSKTLKKGLVNITTDVPKTYQLHPNYPNPFNPSTTISFDLPKFSEVEIIIYDALGKKVRALMKTNMEAGTHQTTWDGKDSYGKNVSSGIYFYTFTAKLLDGSKEIFVKSSKLLLLRL
jgi:hypothetical protein